MFKKTFFFAAVSMAAALCAENTVRNGGFDFPLVMNGSRMYQGIYDHGQSIYASQPAKLWRQTPFSGWWINANAESQVNVEDKGGNILISGSKFSLCSSPLPKTSSKMVVSLYVLTENASGKVVFAGYNHETQKRHLLRQVMSTKEVALPANTNGKWQRIEIPFDGIVGDDAGVNVVLDSGTVQVDNVQIEDGLTATPFELRPDEFLELSMGDFDFTRLPRYYTNRAKEQDVFIRNRSNQMLKGTMTVYLDTWKNPGETVYKEIQVQNMRPGEALSFSVNPGKLPPEAYVVLVEFKDADGKVIIPKDIFDAKNTGGGTIGQSQLTARNGLRFAVFKDIEPKDIFGVANGMIGVPSGNFFGGPAIQDFGWAKDLHYTGFTGDDVDPSLFNYAAAGGVQAYINGHIDGAEEGHPELSNPASKNDIDFHNPKGREIILKRAEAKGKRYAEGPGAAAFKLRNECPYPANGATCPSEAADTAFRKWVQTRYNGDLQAVNKAWHKDYKSWDEVEQIVSAKMANMETNMKKEGAAAIDWMAHMGNLTPEVVDMMHNDPGRAMDWCRWRSAAALDIYLAYAKKLKEYAPDVLVGVNQPWPNFWPQIFMPFWREDAPMLDMQYTAHMTVDLGSGEEMLDIIEMADSVAKGKPIWGIEIYLQPSFHPDFAPLQNWGLLAHGMTQNLVFAWRPYSDHGGIVFKDGNGAWKKPNAVPMWMIIDTDGSKLPAFDTNQRSVFEIENYHKRFDGNSIKRIPTRTGIYISSDSAEFDIMYTANLPFNSTLQNGRQTLAAQLRLSGATLDYFDDPGLQDMNVKDYDTMFVPQAVVMDPKSIDKMAEFVKNGGTLVFLGPCAVYDPCLNLYPEVADGKLVPGWKNPVEWTSHKQLLEDVGKYTERGVSSLDKIAAIPGGKVVKSSAGKEIGWSKKVGEGTVIQLTDWPCRYKFENVQPFPELRAAVEDIVKLTNVPRAAYWVSDDTPEVKGYGRPGNGAPVVEAVLRQKITKKKCCLFFEREEKEMFLYVLNQGGAGRGKVVLADPNWKVTDIINGTTALVKDGAIELDMPAFGYRVFHLTR